MTVVYAFMKNATCCGYIRQPASSCPVPSATDQDKNKLRQWDSQ
ncbi:hypothetical protein T08_8250 [Trichinella sp. T8]|nr:hypothetical protein T08_8250 [Trichinella sp. T8]